MSSSRATVARAWIWAILYVLFVILFGAVVRITGSGAGCGQHWPTCHGEVAHFPQTIETVIELTHRVTSGLSMLLVFFLSFLTYRATAKGHAARRAAIWSCVFMITEALVGAGLVLLELVGENSSVSRAFVMALHLVNTSLLLWAMLAVAWACRFERLRVFPFFSGADGARASVGESLPSAAGVQPPTILSWLPQAGGALLIVVVSAAGAVTALGDTLYPVEAGQSLAVAGQLVRTEGHYLEHLRSVHPILASLSACFWIYWGAAQGSAVGRWIVTLTLVQVAAGLVNIYLSAPAWMQVTHLAIANLLWLAWLLAWTHRAEARVQAEAGIHAA